MPDVIDIIALDICSDAKDYAAYALLTPKEKTDRIAQYIEATCEELKKTSPDSAWHVGWREHGITAAHDPKAPVKLFKGENDAITLADKEYMHQKMSALILKYPQLSIYSGPVVVERSIDEIESKLILQLESELKKDEEKTEKNVLKNKITELLKILEKMQRYYLQNPERNYSIYFKSHKNKTKQLYLQLQKIHKRFHALDPSTVEYEQEYDQIKAEVERFITKLKVRSNTAYIYQSTNDKSERRVSIKEYRKRIPHKEVDTNFPYSLTIFKSNTEKTGNPIVKSTHPSSNTQFDTKVEICAEHEFLKELNLELKEKKTENKEKENKEKEGEAKETNKYKPLLHYVFSDYTAIYLKNLEESGTFVVHFDSHFAPRLIVTELDLSPHPKVNLYTINLLKALDLASQNSPLKKPVEPYYPIEYTVLHQIDKIVAEYMTALTHLNEIYSNYAQQVKAENLNADINLRQELLHLPNTNIFRYVTSLFNGKDLSPHYAKDFTLITLNRLNEELNYLLSLREDYLDDDNYLFFYSHLKYGLEYTTANKKMNATDISSQFQLKYQSDIRDKMTSLIEDRQFLKNSTFLCQSLKVILKTIHAHEKDPQAQYLNQIKPAPGRKIQEEHKVALRPDRPQS
jgi:hypothetical protein